MECLRLLGSQPALGIVGVAFGADRRAEHDRTSRSFLLLANRRHEPDGPTIRLGELVERVAEPRTPRGVRAPGVGLEHEPDAVAARDVEVGLEVAVHRRPPIVLLEEREGGEAGEIEPVREDQRGLHAAVREQHASIQLRQRGAVRHGGIVGRRHGPCKVQNRP